MSAPYVVACLMAGFMLIVLVFYAVRKLGKLTRLKITAQLAKIFYLSFEAGSDNDDSHHDPQLSFMDVEHVVGTLPGWSPWPGNRPLRGLS